MTGAGRWVASHVGLTVTAAVLVAFVTAASVARCQAVHATPDAHMSEGTEELAEKELPETMKALRGSYTDLTKDALRMLYANVWTDARGSTVVGFTDRAIRVVARGEETWKAYAVAASAKRAGSGDGRVSTVTTLCMGTADWTDIATLTVPRGGDAGTYATFQRPSVCGGAELSLSPTLKRVGLDGPGDDVLAAHGTNREAAESSIAEWCALSRPTATAATWTKVVEQDYGDGVTRVYYRLDDRGGSAVTLCIGADGKPSVEEGGRR